MFILETRELRKNYSMGDVEVRAIDGISIGIGRGEFVAVMGPSGSGKTTLLNMLGCLDRPSSGTVLIDGREVTSLSDKELNRVRLEKIGFIFQRVNLIPILSAIENVELPMEISGLGAAERRKRGMELLESVGLAKRATHRPSQLSAGEQQRVGIARSLANSPSIILADEPTGNLDSHASSEICTLMKQLNENNDYTIIVVTHNPEVGDAAQRKVIIRDGTISKDL